MVTHHHHPMDVLPPNHPKDGHPPYKMWSPTFLRMVANLTTDRQPPFPGWSPTIQKVSHQPTIPRTNTHHVTIPRMVTSQPKYGHPPSLIDGQPPSPGWSPTILSLVTNHLQGGHSQSLGESRTFPRMATQLVLFLELIHSQCCYLSKASLNACLKRPIFGIVSSIFRQI